MKRIFRNKTLLIPLYYVYRAPVINKPITLLLLCHQHDCYNSAPNCSTHFRDPSLTDHIRDLISFCHLPCLATSLHLTIF